MTKDGRSYNHGEHPNSEKGRFKKGQQPPVGSGRKKGTKNRNTIIRAVLGQLVSGSVDGGEKKISITEASLLRLSQKALGGDLPSIKLVMALWKEAEDALANEREAEYPFSDADRHVIEDIYARMKACEE